MSKIDTNKLPELYKKYDCYDDGKRRESRRYQVLVTDIIPFNEANEDLIKAWKIAVEQYNYLFATETDYFIFAVSYEWWYPEVEIFVRIMDGGWFGLGTYNPYEKEWDCYTCSGRLIIPE